MVLRYLLNRILNNPYLIEKLAESYPIRRAAQITAYTIQRSKLAAAEALESEAKKRIDRFSADFKQELKQGFEQIEQEQKRRR